VAFAFHGASPGQVWPIGKLSLGLDQFLGSTSPDLAVRAQLSQSPDAEARVIRKKVHS